MVDRSDGSRMHRENVPVYRVTTFEKSNIGNLIKRVEWNGTEKCESHFETFSLSIE